MSYNSYWICGLVSLGITANTRRIKIAWSCQYTKGEQCSDVTAEMCTHIVIKWDVLRKAVWASGPQSSMAVNRSTHSDGPRVRANSSAVGTRVIDLSCEHAATNYVMLSRTILLCAAEIKHA